MCSFGVLRKLFLPGFGGDLASWLLLGGEGRGCTATCDVAFAGEEVLQTVERLQYCDYAIENLRVLCRTFSISF